MATMEEVIKELKKGNSESSSENGEFGARIVDMRVGGA